MSYSLLVALFIGFLSVQLSAHPVAFEGSKGVMGFHSPTLSHNQINYSYKHWWALGIHHFKRSDLPDNRHASLISSNFLFKRWNGEASQANIYGVLGAGKSELSGTSKDIGLGAVQFDIEDREYYFLAKHLQLFNGGDSDLDQTVVRAGLAPYIGDYSDLHTWIILEWQKNQFGEEHSNESLTPFLRFFYRNVLFEIGQSFDGVTKFNYIIHF